MDLSWADIWWSGVFVRVRISARSRPALSRPGRRRCVRSECVLVQIFGVSIRRVGFCELFETNGMDFESWRGCPGSQASWVVCKVVGSCGEESSVSQRSSKVE